MAKVAELVLSAGGDDQDLTTGSVYWIGNATTIIRYGGIAVLTDPNFLHRHEKVALGYGLRSARLTDPAIPLDDLPPIDLVLLSHMHEDHFDKLVARKLDRTLPIITTPHSARALSRMGFERPYALATWDELDVAKGDARLRITATPGRHGPAVVGRLLPPVMGSLLHFRPADGRAGVRLYITGDTLVFPRIREIHRRYPDVDLALLHLGGTRAMGVLVTMDGRQGVEMLRLISPREAIPIHYEEYTVMKSPLSEFQDEVRRAGWEDRVRYIDRGETYAFEVGR